MGAVRRMTPNVRRIAVAAALALLLSASARAQHFPTNDELTARAKALVEQGVPGVVLGVLEADGSTRVVAYGIGGPQSRPLGARSVFEIGSITKTLTATLLADMVAKKEVSLSAPIATYLPSHVKVPSRAGREITLLDLATHHSGLPRLPDGFSPADKANPYADFTVEKLYSFLSNHTLQRDIGAGFDYSNVGMGLVAHILERAGRKGFEALIRERVLDPLRMDMTAITLTKDMVDWSVRGHGPGGAVVPHWYVGGGMAGAGGFRSTAEDLLKYLAANMGRADSPPSRAMRDAHEKRVQINPRQSLGLAWYRQSVNGRTIVGHTGGTAGFRTFIGFDPEKRVALVALTNSGNPLDVRPFFDLIAPPQEK
jgi:serine-type D-Ala-D-Ala carboxypeptidase/endopeptidase